MDSAVPVHVVSPSVARREEIVRQLDGASPVEHDDLAGFRVHADDGRCSVIVDVVGGVSVDSLLGLCEEVADRDRKWTVYLPEWSTNPNNATAPEGAGSPAEAYGTFTVRPLAVGFSVPPGLLPPSVSGGSEGGVDQSAEGDGPPFDLHEILRFIARVRHDINNPLTAGMAEIQLLIMDLGSDGEVGESLEAIQRQLKRIQNLVQALATLRRPAPSVAGSPGTSPGTSPRTAPGTAPPTPEAENG